MLPPRSTRITRLSTQPFFNKLIPALLADGYEVMAAQYGLDSVKGDVEATIRTFGRVSGPILLVHFGCSFR
jgi:hypothetical protein